MKKKEIILFSIVFMIAVIAIILMNTLNKGSEKTLLVTVDKEEYLVLDITEKTNDTFTILSSFGENHVVIEKGIVNVVSANCPTQVCVKTKQATDIGDIIVCLPHKTILEIIQK
jgi:hypothetical protein